MSPLNFTSRPLTIVKPQLAQNEHQKHGCSIHSFIVPTNGYCALSAKDTAVSKAVEAHTFNRSTREAEAELCEFEASLVYKS